MQIQEQAGTVIFVATRPPEAPLERDMEAHGLKMQWARGIEVADALLNSGIERAAIVTELAFPDGNWRDLVDRVRSVGKHVPIVLVTHVITAELWWDALECGVDDILVAPAASRLCQLLEAPFLM